MFIWSILALVVFLFLLVIFDSTNTLASTASKSEDDDSKVMVWNVREGQLDVIEW